MGRIITLTTDFGLNDEYVGVIKGVILSLAPEARIVDLSHGIGCQDLRQAAYVLHSACGYFPREAIHLIVVDPRVGTNRRIVLLSIREQLFLAPDNGVLTLYLREGEIDYARQVECRELFLTPLSTTFHGRDILAPVAAHLASGMAASKVGPEIEVESLVRLPLPEVEIDKTRGALFGTVVRIDHFGNLITNIPLSTYLEICHGNLAAPSLVCVKGREIRGVGATYDSVRPGEVVALFSSSNYLEVAVNQGSAAKLLEAGFGEKVSISLDKPKLTLYK